MTYIIAIILFFILIAILYSTEKGENLISEVLYNIIVSPLTIASYISELFSPTQQTKKDSSTNNKNSSLIYTFEESQDRQLLGVSYKATEKEIKDAYHLKVREYNKIPSADKEIYKTQLAYKRLIKIEAKRNLNNYLK